MEAVLKVIPANVPHKRSLGFKRKIKKVKGPRLTFVIPIPIFLKFVVISFLLLGPYVKVSSRLQDPDPHCKGSRCYQIYVQYCWFDLFAC